MTWFVNLHNLPRGKSLYTALLSDEIGRVGDEIDFVASSRLSPESARVMAETAMRSEGYVNTIVLEVVDQTTGDTMYVHPE